MSRSWHELQMAKRIESLVWNPYRYEYTSWFTSLTRICSSLSSKNLIQNINITHHTSVCMNNTEYETWKKLMCATILQKQKEKSLVNND